MKKIFVIFIVVFSFFIVGCKTETTNLQTKSIAVNDIVINKSYAYVDVGDKIVLTAQVYPFNADNQNIIWKSDDNSIAEVSDGIVVGKSEGRTVITSISADGEYKDKCILYVSSPKLDYNKYPNNSKNLSINKINNEEKIIDSIEEENILKDENLEENDNQNYEDDEIFENDIENGEIKDFYSDYFDFYFNKIWEFNNQMFKLNKEFQEKMINKVSQNKSQNENDKVENFYAFEYKYNSNGIDEIEDENTVYKDDNTIIKEFISKQ